MCIACAHRVCVCMCVCVCVLWCWAMHLYAIFTCLMRALIADTRAPSSRALIFAHELYCCPRFVLLSTLCIVVPALYCCPRFPTPDYLCISVALAYPLPHHQHVWAYALTLSLSLLRHCDGHTSCPLTPSRPHHSHIVPTHTLTSPSLTHRAHSHPHAPITHTS
jgi:hypothetical protein